MNLRYYIAIPIALLGIFFSWLADKLAGDVE